MNKFWRIAGLGSSYPWCLARLCSSSSPEVPEVLEHILHISRSSLTLKLGKCLSIFIVLTTHFTFDNCPTIIPRIEHIQGELAQLGQVFGNNQIAGNSRLDHIFHI